MRVKPTAISPQLYGDMPNIEFARVGRVDDAVSVDLERPVSPAAEQVVMLPEVCAQKLEALHEALLKFQKAMANVAPTDTHLRRGMRKAYEALVIVMGEEDEN